MKRLSLLCVALCSLILFTSNRIGRGFASGQPVTTAPGEPGQYCGSFGCHFSGVFEPELQLSLLTEDGMIADEYTPGENYNVQLVIDHTGNPAGFGFQMVALRDEDESAINNFMNLPQGVRQVNIANRQYIEQNTILPFDTITIDWTAPEQGAGAITIYASGNAVNGNGNSSGDGADTTRLTINEKLTSSLVSFNLEDQINIFPNPASDLIRLSGKLDYNNIELWNLEGQLLKRSKDKEVSIQDLNSGIYILRANYAEGTAVKQIIKI